MSRPYPRIGAEVDGLGGLRSALARYHADPHGPTANPAYAEPLLPALPLSHSTRPGGGAVVPLRPELAPPPAAPDADMVTLVARAQAGDAAAFGELYDRYVSVVYRYVYYRVGAAPLAEDLVSETFLRALRRIGSFTWQGRDFVAWLLTIARNLIADHFKSGRYRLEVATADMLDADRATDGPEAGVLDSMTSATLIEAVKRLNPEQQECVVLRFLQGLSVSETALAMGKSEGAVKALQFRAVRALGRLLPREMIL